MATKVYNEETIQLQDDTEVLLRPAPIGRLRRFQDAWSKWGEAKNDGEALSVLIACAGICLEENFRGKFDSLKATVAESKKGEFLSPEYKEYLEEVIDLDTLWKIIEVCGGIKMNDPKLLEAALAAQNQD